MEPNNRNSSVKTGKDDDPEAHVMMLAFPVVGRTNPMLQFAKRLSSKGVQVTFATTPAFASSHLLLSQHFPSLTIATVSDDLELEAALSNNTLNVDEFIQRFGSIAPHGLARLMKEKESANNPIGCLVYDSSLTWALNIAREHKIYAAPFFPQSSAVSMILFHVFKGILKAPPVKIDGGVSIPGLPVMDVGDLPTFVKEVGKHPVLEKLAFNQFENFNQADFQFFNTFDMLEEEVVNWMLKHWPTVKTIGPAIPSMYLDKNMENDKEYGLSLVNPNHETCIQWLDTKKERSTIFISFGSLAAVGIQQMEELACALKNSRKPFLWVVRASEQSKLPCKFKDEISEHGLIVNWCPQLVVLEHRAVGCFVTHCGWNSTLEAISLGVPVVAMPMWADQPTNGLFLEDVWRVGVRVKASKCNGVVERMEIECCIVDVMEGEKGDEMRRNSAKWKILAKAAMMKGGSSDKNIHEFIQKIRSSA